MNLLLLIFGLFLFVGLVVAHEFGHFMVSRRNGVDVEEFGIGFPPKAWSRKMKGGYIFSLNWLPLGGFVKLKGEHDADKGPGSFGQASLWAKTKIMLAGVGMNLLVAFVLFTILAAIGIPQLVSNQFTVASDTKIIKQEVLVAQVEPSSPASSIGLKNQDQLISISSSGVTHNITSDSSLPSLTKQFAGKVVILNYKSHNVDHSASVQLRSSQTVDKSLKTSNPVGYLGISPTNYILQRSTWSSPIVALGLIKQITILTLKGLGLAIASLFRGNTTQASAQVSGPVGIFVILKNGTLLGYQFVLMIIAVISLSLAIINVLPIPALDGGRLFFTLLPRLIRKKPLKQKTEERIHGSGLAFIMVIFVLITIVDIRRYF